MCVCGKLIDGAAAAAAAAAGPNIELSAAAAYGASRSMLPVATFTFLRDCFPIHWPPWSRRRVSFIRIIRWKINYLAAEERTDRWPEAWYIQ